MRAPHDSGIKSKTFRIFLRHNFKTKVLASRDEIPTEEEMALFQISPFSEFHCNRRTNCGNSLWPSVLQGVPVMEIALPTTAFELFKDREVTGDSVEVKLPLDGYDEDDIEVTVEDGSLKIEARKEEKNDKGETVNKKMFRKVISLPENCDAENVEAEIDEESGVLSITVPRTTGNMESDRTLTQSGNRSDNNLTPQSDDDSEKTLATVPVQGYSPEELSVKVINGGKSIEVSGRHEDKSEGGRSVAVREFTRMFALPDGVDAERIRSCLKGGELIIRAPVVKPAVETEAARSIPIQMEVEKSD